MTLTVGTDSYFTLEEATAYFTSRNIAAWTGDDPVKEAAARVGTSYLDNQYRFIGVRVTAEQLLAWPRVAGPSGWPLRDEDGYEIAVDAIPIQVKRAAMEAALLSIGGTSLEPVLDRGGAIKSTDTVVGPIEESITYQDGAPVVALVTVIDGLLRGLVTKSPGSTSGNVRLRRG